MLPRIEPFTGVQSDPRAIVLVLHGGRSDSRVSGERRRLAYLRMIPFARALARADTSIPAGPGATSTPSAGGDVPVPSADSNRTPSGRGSLEVGMLRYRYRGWNAPARDPLRDAGWALQDLARRHPGTPVALVGHSMGGRAALHAAGAPNVVAVCALAPWLDGSDPVDQLAGRTVLIAHGCHRANRPPVASPATQPCSDSPAPKGSPMNVGDQVSDFEAKDETGASRTLSQLLQNGPAVLFFYPIASTSGCTREACHFRDLAADFAAVGAQPVGISGDDVAKQKIFATTHSLGYPLLSDESHKIAKAFGSWRWWLPGGLHTRRRTFVVGQDRRIIAAITNETRFDVHADEALAALKQHKSAV